MHRAPHRGSADPGIVPTSVPTARIRPTLQTTPNPAPTTLRRHVLAPHPQQGQRHLHLRPRKNPGREMVAPQASAAGSIPHRASSPISDHQKPLVPRQAPAPTIRLPAVEIASPALRTLAAYQENHPPAAMVASYSTPGATTRSSLHPSKGARSTGAQRLGPPLRAYPPLLPCNPRF